MIQGQIHQSQKKNSTTRPSYAAGINQRNKPFGFQLLGLKKPMSGASRHFYGI
jgi:hypothetical protein